MMQEITLLTMLTRIWRAPGQGKSAKSVEVFGWLILFEGVFILFSPHFVASVLHLPALVDQAANYFRLVGLLVSGLGTLYVVSGRLNAQGFVFASMLDRPLVPVLMGGLWYFEVLPGTLALAFSVQDFGGFIWTFFAWRSERYTPHD